MRTLFYITILFFLCSFTTSTLKKVSDENYRYEFYTTAKQVKAKTHKTYFWFKGGKIHMAKAGVAGTLLQGDFKKYYHSNQLAEQGTFKLGVKHGVWKTWYESGVLKSLEHYTQGVKTGKALYYTTTASIQEKGNYHKDFKNGKWINYTTQDTLFYKKGEVKLPKPKKETLKKFKKYFHTKKIFRGKST